MRDGQDIPIGELSGFTVTCVNATRLEFDVTAAGETFNMKSGELVNGKILAVCDAGRLAGGKVFRYRIQHATGTSDAECKEIARRVVGVLQRAIFPRDP